MNIPRASNCICFNNTEGISDDIGDHVDLMSHQRSSQTCLICTDFL